MKLLADRGEPIARVPLAAEPVEVQEAPASVPDEIRHVAIANRVPPRGAKSDHREFALHVRVFLPEGKQFRQFGRTQSLFVKFRGKCRTSFLLQHRLNKHVDISRQHVVHARSFDVGTMIFYHLIWIQYI